MQNINMKTCQQTLKLPRPMLGDAKSEIIDLSFEVSVKILKVAQKYSVEL